MSVGVLISGCQIIIRSIRINDEMWLPVAEYKQISMSSQYDVSRCHYTNVLCNIYSWHTYMTTIQCMSFKTSEITATAPRDRQPTSHPHFFFYINHVCTGV